MCIRDSLFEQALAITVGMADTVMISSAGEAAVSGVSLIDMFNNLIISVLAALATGGAVVTSQFLGAGKKEDACKSAKQLIVSSVCITIGISILVMVFCNGIISLFFGKIEADVFHNAVIYMMISALSFPFLALYNSCAALFRSMGNSQITLKAVSYTHLRCGCEPGILPESVRADGAVRLHIWSYRRTSQRDRGTD